MSNLKNLQNRIKTEVKSLPREVNVEYTDNGDDQPNVYLDGFSITFDGDGYFAVTDETGGIDDFAGTADQIVEFFKGVYDAYVEDYNEAKSNEYYDKGYELTQSTDDGDDEDEEVEEDEEYEEDEDDDN